MNPAAPKIIATSATIGGALPNSGAMFGMLAAMGLNHKNSYKHIAAISIGAGALRADRDDSDGEHRNRLGPSTPQVRGRDRGTGIMSHSPKSLDCCKRRGNETLSPSLCHAPSVTPVTPLTKGAIMKETPVAGKAPNEVKAPARGRAPDAAGKASLFERVPDAARLAWPDIAAILSGVVSSLSKLMGGGIVAFYAGCQLGGVAMAITFALSFVLTYLVGKITFREGLPNNVVSRLYIFGTKGPAAGSLVWIFLLVGVLAVGTVQLGNAILFAFGWSEEWMRWALFAGISCVWVLMALFGTKAIARMNAVFVVALFAVMGYVVYLVAANGQMGDALTHGVLIPGVEVGEGFAYGVNYAIMTSGLLALFAADFTRFARRERDLVPISLVGSLFAVVTYLFGALITYFGFEQSAAYFTMGYDAGARMPPSRTRACRSCGGRRWGSPSSACRR